MGTIIGFFVERGLSERAARAVSYVLGAIAVIALLGSLIAAYNAHVIHNHEQKLVARAAPATATATNERANDAVIASQKEEEFHNAIHSVPDQTPDAPNRALACQRLRNRGHAPASCG